MEQKKYQAWVIPTRHCFAVLNQKPFMLCEGKNKEDIEMDCYLDECDDPAPDKNDYFMWHVECVNIN